MKNEAYFAALKNALTEIKNICPDVQTSFLFDREGTIIADDNETPEVPLEKTIDAMEGIFEKTETIGGLDDLVINANKGRIHVSCVNDMYLALVTTRNADMTYLQTVSRVLIPTVVKLLDNIAPAPFKLPSSKPSLRPLPSRVEREEMEEEEQVEEASRETAEEEFEEESPKAEEVELPSAEKLHAPTNQLIVDTLGGLLVRGDTVQIDQQILDEWSEYYDGTEITTVEIESFNGNSIQCKVKPIKDSKIEGKGIVRIPERASQDLDVKKGELVKVKPFMEEE